MDPDIPGYTRIDPGRPRGGPGEGVRYHIELRIRVRVKVWVKVQVKVRGRVTVRVRVMVGGGVTVKVKVRVTVMMGRTSLIPTRPTLTIKLYPPILSKAAHQAPDVF